VQQFLLPLPAEQALVLVRVGGEPAFNLVALCGIEPTIGPGMEIGVERAVHFTTFSTGVASAAPSSNWRRRSRARDRRDITVPIGMSRMRAVSS